MEEPKIIIHDGGLKKVHYVHHVHRQAGNPLERVKQK